MPDGGGSPGPVLPLLRAGIAVVSLGVSAPWHLLYYQQMPNVSHNIHLGSDHFSFVVLNFV